MKTLGIKVFDHKMTTILKFTGKVRSGKGEHSKLLIPGAEDISDPPPDWPIRFYPGSLNIDILSDGYPQGFAPPESGGRGVSPLDDGGIEPTVVLPWDKIGDNKLNPKKERPRRGTGQFWPSVLTVVATTNKVDCWVFRRIDSTIERQLELVSNLALRAHLCLKDGMEVTVELLGKR